MLYLWAAICISNLFLTYFLYSSSAAAQWIQNISALKPRPPKNVSQNVQKHIKCLFFFKLKLGIIRLERCSSFQSASPLRNRRGPHAGGHFTTDRVDRHFFHHPSAAPAWHQNFILKQIQASFIRMTRHGQKMLNFKEGRLVPSCARCVSVVITKCKG